MNLSDFLHEVPAAIYMQHGKDLKLAQMRNVLVNILFCGLWAKKGNSYFQALWKIDAQNFSDFLPKVTIA